MRKVHYIYARPGERRRHYINQEDVEVLLSRLPDRLWTRLRAVHFNDRGRGCRCLGYVATGRREITICALPPRVSLSRFLVRSSPSKYLRRCSPWEFGAMGGRQWPELAVRRFMIYDVFLHELGHLQVVDPKARRPERMFASQTMAQRFADDWRDRLWSAHFAHADPVHNRPSPEELQSLEAGGTHITHGCHLE